MWGWTLRRSERLTLRFVGRAMAFAALMAAGLPGSVSAQALSCAIPVAVPTPRPAGPNASEPVRRLPVVGYTLALSWSPQYCKRANGPAVSFQCGDKQRFGFVLHGLWPDGQGRQWPQYCSSASALPPRVVRETLCVTPSADLMQHEWAKHGTCGWRDPADYFGTGRRLYGALRYPDMGALSRRRDLTVAQFRDAFVRANAQIPGLTEGGVRVRTGKSGWLEEVWLCLDRKLAHARCGRGQQGGAAPGQRISIWRGNSSPRRQK